MAQTATCAICLPTPGESAARGIRRESTDLGQLADTLLAQGLNHVPNHQKRRPFKGNVVNNRGLISVRKLQQPLLNRENFVHPLHIASSLPMLLMPCTQLEMPAESLLVQRDKLRACPAAPARRSPQWKIASPFKQPSRAVFQGNR